MSNVTNLKCDIAVIGIGFRYPAANNKEQLHRMLFNGENAPVDKQNERGQLLGIEEYAKLINNIRCIDDVEMFDNSFFGIVKPEAMEMPPEMRFSLMCAAEAIMDAGYSIDAISNKNCGVVVAHGTNSYRKLLPRTTFLSFFNNMPGMTCGYLAHYLKLLGPAYHLDSTCSSSLTAIANACNHLIMGQADYMLAGGVQICLPITEQEGKDMSSSVLSLGSDQRCIPFDENANGFYNSEGVGFVLLKRYDEALRDNDHIYGIIKGYGFCSNSDYSPTIYAPNAKAQNVALNKAWGMAGITSNDITEFEAHGAATKQGDTAEIENLTIALSDRSEDSPVLLTAVKSNLGHTVCAAGITSLIKVLLGFENDVVYPIAGFSLPSSKLDFEQAHVKPIGNPVLVKPNVRRVVDIGSYGLNELNVHLVVENDTNKTISVSSKAFKFLKCSAKSEQVLCNYISMICDEIQDLSDERFNQVICTLNTGRDDFAYRCFITFENQSDLISKLSSFDSTSIVKCKPSSEIRALDDINSIKCAYLSGDKLDWDKIYRDVEFHKVSTVKYPFAKKRIWPTVDNKTN